SPASDTGPSAADNVTADATPTFTGIAEPGSAVQLMRGTAVLGGTTVSAGGTWSISAALPAGTSAVFAHAVDPAGNAFDSAALSVTVDTTAPAVSAPDLDPASDS